MDFKRNSKHLLLHWSKYSDSLLNIVPINPFSATIKVTENCNSRCITCNHWKTKHKNELSTKELVEIFHELRRVGVYTIGFTGGEPLLRDDIQQLVLEAKNFGFRDIKISSNGLLLQKKAKELIKSGITEINVSLDGIGETNDRIRGIVGGYETTLKGIREFVKLRREKVPPPKMNVATVLSEYNIAEVPKLIELCQELGVGFGFNLLDENPYFFRGTDVPKLAITSEKQIDWTIEFLHRFPSIVIFDHKSLEYARAYLKNEIADEPPCVLGYTNIKVGSKGEVFSGCWVLGPLGNLRQQKLKEIFNGKKYKERCRRMFKRQCPGCACGFTINIQVANLLANYLMRANSWLSARNKRQGSR